MSLAMASAPSWRSSWRSGTARGFAAWWWRMRWRCSLRRLERRSAPWRSGSRSRPCRRSSILRSGACFRPSSPGNIRRSSLPAKQRSRPSTRNALRAPASRLRLWTSARAPKKSRTRPWCCAARWIRPRRRRWRAPWRGAFRARITRRSRARATARCSSNPMRCWRKWASFWPAGRIEPAGGSGAAEPVVALVLPIAARVLVGDEDRGDVLGVFEAHVGGHAQLHGEAVFRRQDLVGKAQGEQRLRVQGGRHVDAGRVIVGALEADVLRRGIGADALEEIGKAHSAPLADRAPALDADVPRDLRYLRQRVELGQPPGLRVADHAAELELVVGAVDDPYFALAVVAVERERPGDPALGEFGCQAPRIEEPVLHAVIPARHRPEKLLHALGVGQLAAGQQRQRAERQPALQEQPPLEIRHLRRTMREKTSAHLVAHDALRMRPVNMLGKVRGTRITMITCTMTISTTAAMAKKCTTRAPS